MKTQTIKQPAHYSLKVEEKIKKYGRIRNGLFALGVAGVISVLSSPVIFSKYEQSEIAKTYQTAQTTIQELQNKRKNLKNKLENFSYQTPEIKELEENLNKEYNETIFEIDEAIKSVKVEISEKASGSEFEQYQRWKKARKKQFDKFFLGGGLALIFGTVGGGIFNMKKDKLKNKTKK